MNEHVKTGCKHIPPSEQPLQFQSEYFLNKQRIIIFITILLLTGSLPLRAIDLILIVEILVPHILSHTKILIFPR